MSSDVQNFYAGKTVFITGTTGFLGQLLLRKLLCSCPEIRCIYVLIREKRGKLVDQRLKEIFDDSIFDRARELHPDYETKVRPIKGDCSESNLGISDSDRELIEKEVEIIFHSAASLSLNTPLRAATYDNVRSLDILLDIAKKTVHLKTFVYVSTAYSPIHETKSVEEKFYNAPISAHKLLPFVEDTNDEVLNGITPKLMKPIHNVYLYTKLIAEDLCREKGSGLPICVFRPALILPCYREPFPGWINNWYGPMGTAYGHALGIIKVLPGDLTKLVPLIPGDYTVNALILSAYHTGTWWERTSDKLKFDIPVINYSNTATNFSMNWETFFNELDKALEKYPFYNMVLYPYTKVIANFRLYQFLTLIFHFFPAIALDSALIITGKTPRFTKLFRKLHELLCKVTSLLFQEVFVSCRKINEIGEQLSEKDRDIFYYDLNDLNIQKYFDVFVRGMRLYLAKDPETTLQKAKEKRKRLLVLNYVLITLLIFIFLFLLMTLVRFIGMFLF